MPKASKKRPRDDIPSVPIGSSVWIVKSWRELPGYKHAYRDYVGVSYKEYCQHGVFATVEAAIAEARRARDRLVAQYEISEEEDEKQEEEEGTEEEEEEEEEERTEEEVEEDLALDEEMKKIHDEQPFVYCYDLEDDEDLRDMGSLRVEVKKHNVR